MIGPIRQHVNVLEYCVGDGTTDDSTAMNAALTLGGVVLVPFGATVRCASNLMGVSNTHLIVDGQLLLDMSRLSFIGAGVTNVTLSGRGSIKSVKIVPPAPTAVIAAGAGVTAGLHSYRVTFVAGGVETNGGAPSAQVTTSGANLQVNLSNVPIGPTGTTARNIYRTVAGDTGSHKLQQTIANNTSTTATDNTPDGSLGAVIPNVKPTNWARRGIVEFGGTFASIGDGFILDSLEVYGDFSGIPTGYGATSSSERVGVLTTNAKNVVIRNCNIHNTWDEAIIHNGDGIANGDTCIDYIDNKIHHCNHDAIGPMIQNIQSFYTNGNRMWECLVGIEAPLGIHENNLAFKMQGAGYTFGGNQLLDGLVCVYSNNTGASNQLANLGSTYDFDFQSPGPSQGLLVLTDNNSYGCGTGGFVTSFVATVIAKGNTAVGWGALSSGGIAFVFGGSATTLDADNNSALNEGAHSTGGVNMWGTKILIGSHNRLAGVAVPYPNIDTSALGWLPDLRPVLATSQQSHTGDTSLFTFYTKSIPANTLGKAGGFHIHVAGQCTGNNNSKTINVKFGGTTLVSITVAAGASAKNFSITVVLYNAWLTNSQIGSATIVNDTAASTAPFTAAVDTTAAKSIVIDGQLNNLNDSMATYAVTIEPINATLP